MEWLKNLVEWSHIFIGGGHVLWYIVWGFIIFSVIGLLLGTISDVMGMNDINSEEKPPESSYSVTPKQTNASTLFINKISAAEEDPKKFIHKNKQQEIKEYFYNVVKERNNSQYWYYCSCISGITLHKYQDPYLEKYSNIGHYTSKVYCTRCNSNNSCLWSESFKLDI